MAVIHARQALLTGGWAKDVRISLDGGRIAVSLLPGRLSWHYARLEPYGFPILLVLLFTGILGDILWPLIAGFRFLLSTVLGF